MTDTTTDPITGTVELVADALDPEAEAINAISLALRALAPDARDRVLMHALNRFPFSGGPAAGEPRCHSLDDLPATGDLIHVDGRDLPISGVIAEIEGGGLAWAMTAGPVPAEEGAPA